MSATLEAPAADTPTASAGRSPNWPLIAVFMLTTFVSAVLLFLVQPLIGKYILPWFGGGTAVWTACLVFFQTALFAGYVYAHTIVRWLNPVAQLVLHGVLLVAAICLLPITPSDAWRPTGAEDPALRIMALLAVTLGVPYLVLSATSPLIQAWWSKAFTGTSPYRLYALSNVGSLSSLLLYPFLIEPNWEVTQQTQLWSWVFIGFCVLCFASAVGTLWRAGALGGAGDAAPAEAAPTAEETGMAGFSFRLWWVLLPAFASLVLMATTNFVCQLIAPVPFLWVLPLSLYLLTFIICFEKPSWYRRGLWLSIAIIASLAIPGRADFERFLERCFGIESDLVMRFGLYLIYMFSVCMVCHGELYKLRPRPQRLTEYYLFIAFGGALGGVFVSLVAPVVFKSYFEWDMSYYGGYLLACGAMIHAVWYHKGWPLTARAVTAVSASVLSVAGAVLMYQISKDDHPPIEQARNFYGCVEIFEMQPDNEEMHRFTMQVDGVTHGKQFVRRDKWMNGTAYYGPQCGAARAIRYAQQRAGRPIRIGGVGMGVGTLAVYTRPGDLMRFYEINPACEVFARKYFHFLDASPGETEVILGDARVCLERELASGKPQRYDVLALDAFSGHAVPSHLLTVEAFEVYKRHLKSNAIIAVHISNHYLDLAPVVFAAARHNGYGVTLIENRPDWDEQVQASSWVLMSKDQRFIETHPMELCPDEGEPPRDEIRELPAWTDARSSLYEILRWK